MTYVGLLAWSFGVAIGPVMSPAPTGEAAVKFWDAIIAAGGVPGFFELKRTREVGPVFGERPTIG